MNVETPSIWDAPPTTRDENSRAAAQSMKASAGSIRAEVLDLIGDCGPIAEWEIERYFDLAGNTIRPRVWELMKAGAIARHPEKGTTPSGRSCWRYVITETGRDIQ